MTVDDASLPDVASDVARVAALFAVDPIGLGGVVLRARTSPIRERWLSQLRTLLPETSPVRRLPLQIEDGRLLGGLDLAATLRAGRPVVERGLLAETDGGVLLLAMAERIPAATAARLAAILDTGEVVLERDGVAGRMPAHLGMIALDEGIDDERLHPTLAERLAFSLDLDGVESVTPFTDRDTIDAARRRLPLVFCNDSILAVLAETALALGVGSLRADVFVSRVARISAALDGRVEVDEADAATAARLVLAPRATRLPVPPPVAEDGATPPQPSTEAPEERDQASQSESQEPADTPHSAGDLVLAAARAAIPPGLLLRLQAEAQRRSSRAPAGKAGAMQLATRRGRPAGTRRGEPRGGRLNLIETLRAAAPWQSLRRRIEAEDISAGDHRRIEVRSEDFRVTRFKQRTETTTLFVVDASGSLALNRLAEAKGAVELLLRDCYVRRDQVALMAFRGKGADLLLPPTRSLVRAKRSLAGLPGGGATPLATAIDRAIELGDLLRRRGQTPVIVFLTDGRGNVARDGSTGREAADRDATSAARAARLTGIRTLVVDAAQRPQASARRLAADMGALYIPLPHADAAALSNAIRATTG